MPSSPTGATSAGAKNTLFVEDNAKGFKIGVLESCVGSKTKPKGVKFLSQPMPKGSVFGEGGNMNQNPNVKKFKDKRFDSFKTWSGKLERQLTNLRGKQGESVSEEDSVRPLENEALPVDRYFDALEGPELETLRVCNVPIFPQSFNPN